MKKMNTIMKKVKSRKGFTLVEVIIVLVILAILAAMLIPALTGYINKANEKALTAECRSVVMAAQTEISEYYGLGGTAPTVAVILELAEVSSTSTASITAAGGKVTKVTYSDGTNQITYENGAYSAVTTGTVENAISIT